MKYFLLLVTFIQCSFFSLTQWQRIRTMDRTDYNNYNYQEIISPSPEKIFYTAHTKINSSSISNAEMIYSFNGGESWDSLIFYDRAFNTMKYLSDDFIYFVTFQLVYLPSQSPYSRKFLHLSEDGGQTWVERLIDSTSNGMTSNALTFFNDSVAIIREKIGCCITQSYVTRDQGINWHSFDLMNYNFSTLFVSDTVVMSGQGIATVDMFNNTYNSQVFSGLGQGSIQSFDVSDTKLVRMIAGQDGPEQGYSHNNYLILTVDEFPLGNQKVLHYPSLDATPQICYNGSQLNFLYGHPMCSKDDGDSFFWQEVDDPNSNNLDFFFLDFADENVGYSLSRDVNTGVVYLFKTTNGGGVTENYAPSPIVKLASIEQLEEDGFSVYPNPTSDELTISSIENIIQISLFQLDGKLVESEIEVGLHFKMNLSNLKTGTYIIELTTDKGSIRKKINKI